MTVDRCAFAERYSPPVCRLMSSLDAGLIAGLTDGGRLVVLGADHRGATAVPRPDLVGEGVDVRRRAVVVGSGAGGATVAKELQGAFDVTVLEAGRDFRRATLDRRSIERLRRSRLLVDPGLVRLVYPPIRIRRTPDMLLVNGIGTGGTTTMATGNGIRMDEDLRALGLDLDREFDEIAREIPITTAHQRRWHPTTRRLFRTFDDLGLDPVVLPKMGDAERCRHCGRCMLGCPYGRKWDSRAYLDEAVRRGARLMTGSAVTEVVIEGGRATGVVARTKALHRFIPADLVVLAAGGFGTPADPRTLGHRVRADAVRRPGPHGRGARPERMAVQRDRDAVRRAARGLHPRPILRLDQQPVPSLMASPSPGHRGHHDQARGRERGSPCREGRCTSSSPPRIARGWTRRSGSPPRYSPRSAPIRTRCSSGRYTRVTRAACSRYRGVRANDARRPIARERLRRRRHALPEVARQPADTHIIAMAKRIARDLRRRIRTLAPLGVAKLGPSSQPSDPSEGCPRLRMRVPCSAWPAPRTTG